MTSGAIQQGVPTNVVRGFLREDDFLPSRSWESYSQLLTPKSGEGGRWRESERRGGERNGEVEREKDGGRREGQRQKEGVTQRDRGEEGREKKGGQDGGKGKGDKRETGKGRVSSLSRLTCNLYRSISSYQDVTSFYVSRKRRRELQ